MLNLTRKQLLILCIILLLLDSILLYLYVDRIEPNVLMSVGLESYRLKIILFNLVIAFLVLLIKRKYSLIFIGNAILSAFMITFFWNLYLKTHPFSMTQYSVEYNNCKYVFHIEYNPNNYSISHAIDSSFSHHFNDEEKMYLDLIMENTIHLSFHEKVGDSIGLHKKWFPETQEYSYMYFYKDTLIDFPEKGIKLKVTEIPYQ